MTLQKKFKRSLIYVILIIVSGVSTFPIIWLILNSFKKPVDMLSSRIFPSTITLENFQSVLTQGQFLAYLINSIIITLGTVGLAVLIAYPAAYGFARFRFRFNAIFLSGFMVVRMVPTIALIIPYFVFFRHLGLIDTRLGLILANVSLRLPFLVWILTVFLQEIPIELEQAARVDGCNRLQVLLKIVLPLSAPGLAAGCIFTFIGAWNELLLVLPLSRTIASKTMSVGVTENIAGYEVMWGPLMASGVVYIIPTIVFTMLIQRWIAKGLTAGAVKG